MFEPLTDAQREMLQFIQSGNREDREGALSYYDIILKCGRENIRYLCDPLMGCDYIEKVESRSSKCGLYVTTLKGQEYLAWERKRVEDERQSAEDRERERKYANRKYNVSLVFSAAALLVSLLANLGKIIEAVQMIVCWVIKVFH